jgi:hypothetical protein
MDYCSTCRRHLNGALVCPGCGAYAPDIAPPVVTSPPAPDRNADMTTVGASAAAPGALWDDNPAWEPASRPAEDVPAAEVTAVTAARPGRAARRRQLARLKKHQRRAMVATAFALVGGGLSLATLDRHTAGPAQAATTPDDRAMGGAKDEVREDPNPPEPTSPAAPRPPRTESVAASEQHASGTGIPRRQPVSVASATEPRPVAPPATAPPTDGVSSPPRQASGSATEGGTASTASSPSGTSGTSGSSGASSTSGTSGTSGTTAQPAPAPTTGGTSSTSGTGTGSQGTATSPAQLCLLGLCLG